MNSQIESIIFGILGICLSVLSGYIAYQCSKTFSRLCKAPNWDCDIVNVSEKKTMLLGASLLCAAFALYKLRMSFYMLFSPILSPDIILGYSIDFGWIFFVHVYRQTVLKHVIILEKNRTLKKCGGRHGKENQREALSGIRVSQEKGKQD